jgi:hypothetical protein
VLVIGSLPPPQRTRSLALRAEVVSLLAAGDTVEVVAPDPVATAHRYLAAGGIPGCLQLARTVSGFDSVVVQLQSGLPVRARAKPFERTLSLLVFSLVLRRARRVVVRLERLEDLPGGPAGQAAMRVWRAAERIELGDEEQLARFVAELGRRADRLSLSSRPALATRDEEGTWADGSEASLADVLELIRSRAARERRALAPSDAAHVAGWDRLATPGIAMTDSDAALLGPPEAPRKPADLARKALAAADRRPSLWRAARFARLARRGAREVLHGRPDVADDAEGRDGADGRRPTEVQGGDPGDGSGTEL